MGSQTTHPLMVIDLIGICIILSCLLGPSNGDAVSNQRRGERAQTPENYD